MKKAFSAVALVPSLLIASSVIVASSDGSVTQLSEVADTVKQIQQEQGFQGKPLPPGHQPGHPGQPPKPPQPGQPGHPPQPPVPQPPVPQPPQPPQPPKPVDTTHAYNAGLRDGSDRGVREGRREGYAEGIDAGEREGRRNGYNDGDRTGRAAGERDGYNVDQAAGTQQGNIDGQSAGINNGTEAGKRRCYDEGYTTGYNAAYAEGKQQGLQDMGSYNAGFAKGQADASVIEAEKGQRAGYQAGFSQREAELQNSFNEVKVSGTMAARGVRGPDLPIEMARNGYATPEERQAYDRGFREGYQRAYRRAFDDARRDGYNERYTLAYRRAYDNQYSISYRQGFIDGKEKGYKAAYRAAYNSAYAAFYAEYSGREYPDQRELGLGNGRATGYKEGFAAGSAEQNKVGYQAGYAKKASEVYPGAFEAGKQAGIAAADKYYAENSVVKLFNAAFYDEDNDGKFEAGENVMLRGELRNFGFRPSETVAVAVKSERGEIVLAADLRADSVAGRANAAVNLAVGRLYDVVAPDSDALYVQFSEKGRPVGDYRQMYTRTNPNKVAVINKDDTAIKEKAGWLFVGTVAKLNAGAKVLITGEKDDWYKVRKSDFVSGDWSEGFVKKGKLSIQ